MLSLVLRLRFTSNQALLPAFSVKVPLLVMLPMAEAKAVLPPGDKVPPLLIVTEPELLKGPAPARMPEPETITAVPPSGASTCRIPPEIRVLPVYTLLVGPEADRLMFV